MEGNMDYRDIQNPEDELTEEDWKKLQLVI